ncbi:unnamed protein product [Choristocarpus tenellus]
MNMVISQDRGPGHLCEVQLHLKGFYDLKEESHKVYEWARELKVTHSMEASHLFRNWSNEVTEKMILLGKQNWNGLGDTLSATLHMVGRYNESVEEWKKVHQTKLDQLEKAKTSGSDIRRAVIAVVKTVCNMVPSVIAQVRMKYLVYNIAMTMHSCLVLTLNDMCYNLENYSIRYVSKCVIL